MTTHGRALRGCLAAAAMIACWAVPSIAGADGDLDAGFGTGGVQRLAPTTANDTPVTLRAYRMLALPDGGFVVAATDSDGSIALVRTGADGALDETFGDHGVAHLAVPPFAGYQTVTPDALRVDDAGRIGVAALLSHTPEGYETPTEGNDVLVGRLTSSGLPDSTFGTGGTVLASSSAPCGARDAAFRGDGTLVVLGACDQGAGDQLTLDTLSADGSADPAFAPGERALPATVGDLQVKSWRAAGGLALAPTTSGRIYVGVQADDGTTSHGGVVAFDRAGALVDGFGAGGVVLGTVQEPGAIALAPDDKVLVAGTSSDTSFVGRLVVARYDGSGHPDSGFGDGGELLLEDTVLPAAGATVQSLAVGVDGAAHLLFGAVVTEWTPYTQGLDAVRLTPAGRLDTAFTNPLGGTGWARVGLAGFDVTPQDEAVLADGRLVVLARYFDRTESQTRVRAAAAPAPSGVLLARLAGHAGPPLVGRPPVHVDDPVAETPLAPSPAPAPPAVASSSVILPAQRVCGSRRLFRIHLRPKGVTLVSAVVKVNGVRVRVLRGSRMRSIVDLRGLPLGSFKVSVDAKDAAGRHYRETRRYHPCRHTPPASG